MPSTSSRKIPTNNKEAVGTNDKRVKASLELRSVTEERRANGEQQAIEEELTQLLATSLSQVQRSFAKHTKELSKLKRVYLQSNINDSSESSSQSFDDGETTHVSKVQRKIYLKAFRKSFFLHLNRVLTVYEREAAVERIVQFIVNFIVEVTSEGGELEKGFSSSDCLLLQIIKYLSKHSAVGEKAVRFRCCQLLSLLISKFAKQISQHESFIVEELREVLLTRTKDKIPIVRQFALSALLTLQTSEEASRDSPVIRLARATREGLKLLSSDPSKDVRKVAVCNISVNKFTLPELLKRLRDINAEVRSSTLTLLKDRVKMDMLEFEHIKELVDNGLRDREPKVQEACVDLFSHWFENYDRDAERFLSPFRVQENEEGTELVIKRLMMKLHPTSYSFSDFTPEAVFYWRIFCEFIRRNAMDVEDSEVQDVFPEIMEIAVLVEEHGDNPFTLKQLLLLALCLDFSDEAGRRKLIQVLRSSLSSPNVTSTVLPLIIKVLKACCDSEAQYQQLVLEAVSDISDPLEVDEDSESGNEEQTEDAEASKKKEEAWAKCLAISSEILIHTRKDMSDPGIAGLLETVILPCIPHQNPVIRRNAIRCLGLLCLLDKVTAEDYLVLFLQAVNNDTEEIQTVAIQALFDLMLVYGASELTIDAEQEDFLMRAFDPTRGSVANGKDKEPLPPLVSTLLKVARKHPELVCEGFAKLLFSGALLSPKVVSKIILIYFDTTTKNQEVVQNKMNVFFPAFAFKSPRNQECIERAFQQTVSTVLKAKSSSVLLPTSSLRDVSVFEMARFFIYLTDWVNLDPKSSKKKEHSLHNRLAMAMATEVLATPQGEARNLCRAFTLLNLSITDEETTERIKEMTRGILEDVTDAVCFKAVEKFREVHFPDDPNPTKATTHPKATLPQAPKPRPTTQTPKKAAVPKRDTSIKDIVSPVKPKKSDGIQEKSPPRKTSPRKPKSSSGPKKTDSEFDQMMMAAMAKQRKYFDAIDEFEFNLEEDHSTTLEKKLRSSFIKDNTTTPKPTLPSAPKPQDDDEPPAKRMKKRIPIGNKRDHHLVEDEDEIVNSPSPSPPPLSRRRPSAARPLPSAARSTCTDIRTTTVRESEDSISSDSSSQSPYGTKKQRREKVIAFAGIKDPKWVRELAEKAKSLHCTVVEDEGKFDASVTHVVVPVNTRTLKTMVASLLSRWLVAPEWLLQSFEAGYLLPESSFGQRCHRERPFESKRVLLSQGFKDENASRLDLRELRLLVEQVGRGKVEEQSLLEKNQSQDSLLVDYVLVSVEEKAECPSEISRRLLPHSRLLTWKEFFMFVQPTILCV